MYTQVDILDAFESIRQTVDGIGNAGVHDQVQQRHIVEWRYFSWRVSFDISVDEVPHVGLVGFQVQVFGSGIANDLA